MEQVKPEAQAVAEIVKQYYEPKVIEVDTVQNNGEEGVSVLVVPKGMEVHSLRQYVDPYLEAPRRRKGTAKLADLASFIQHVNRFKDRDSVLFANADPAAPALLAVFDYHRSGEKGAPRFGEHRAIYYFPLTDEWKVWKANDNNWMTQMEFALFIEDRIADLSDPSEAGATTTQFLRTIGAELASPARLMDLSQGLSVRVDQKVAKAVNLSSGETQVQYAETHSDGAGGNVKVPRAFMIAVRVFQNDDAWKIAARLRYRINEGTIRWCYSLYRTDLVFDEAFKESCDEAQEHTELPLFYGAPEG